MPAFTFLARDATGRPQQGRMDASDLGMVVSSLRTRGWVVLDIKSADDVPAAPRFNYNPLNWIPPGKVDVEVGFSQIASMLRSGLTLLTALKTAAEQSRRPSMARIWEDVYEQIEEGSSFADALARHKQRFPEFVIELVRVGEESGTLERVLTRAAEQLERKRALRATVLNAMMYPAIVLLMAIAVTAFMVISLIPKLQKFLNNRHKKLPPITQALIDISNFTQDAMPYLVVIVPCAIVAAILLYRVKSARLLFDRFILRVPIIGKVLRVAATAEFARSLGLMLESGVSLLASLDTVRNLLGNHAIAEHIVNVHESVMQGGTLAAPLIERRIFMPMLSRMIAVGETTGTLDPVLKEVAEFHEKELAGIVRRLSVLIEPVIIVVVGGIVGFVYLAFFLALYSTVG